MNLIACVDKNWAIGHKGSMLFNIKSDLKHFKETTIDGVVVMGYNTYLSIPNHYLPNRVNIVITHRQLDDDNVITVKSINDLFILLYSKYGTDVFVIGGEKIYKQLYKYCRAAYISKVNDEKQADRYLVNLDKDKNWSLVKSTDKIDFTLDLYINNKVKPFITKNYFIKAKLNTTLYHDSYENTWVKDKDSFTIDTIKKSSILYFYEYVEDYEVFYEVRDSKFNLKMLYRLSELPDGIVNEIKNDDCIDIIEEQLQFLTTEGD